MKKTQKLKTISLLLALSVLVMTGCSASIADETPSHLTSKVGVQSEEISSSLEPEENPEKDKVFSEGLQDEEETKEPEKDEPEDVLEKTTEEDVEEVQEEKEESEDIPEKTTEEDVEEVQKEKEESEEEELLEEEISTEETIQEEKEDEPQEELKSVEEIAKEVLNGKWGNGEERRNKLESSGYDYYEVQSEVSKLIPPEPKPEPKPVVKKSSSSSSSSSNSESYSYSAPNNSITIGGYNLPISNKSTQSRLDARYKEVVNWGSSYIGYKYNNDGQSIYLAVHRDSYGWLFPSNSSFKFKDAGGNTKTYHLSEVKGPFKYRPYVDDLQFDAMQGIAGDAIYVQTCIEGSNGSSTYKIYIYR